MKRRGPVPVAPVAERRPAGRTLSWKGSVGFERLLTGLVVLLAPLALAWPLPADFARQPLTYPRMEGAVHIWGLWTAWMARAPLVVATELVSFPQGQRFVLADPAHMPIFGLGHALGGPAAGYNLVLYCGLAVAGLGGALLARQVGGAAWLGALVAAACPALLACPADGATEAFGVGWVAVQLALLLAYARSGRRLHGLGAALALALACYSGPYNGVWAAMIDLSVAVALLLRRRERGLALRLTGVGGLAAVLVMPLAWALLTQRLASMSGSAARAGLPEIRAMPHWFRGAAEHGADLADPWLPVQLTGGGAYPTSHTAYLGLAALLLACVALWRRRELWPWLAGALAFSLLSLGPWLYWRGHPLQLGEGHVLGPAGLLTLALPSFFGRITCWYRAGAVASLLLAPLVSVLGRGRWGPLAALLVLADLLLCAPLAWPLHSSALPDAQPLLGTSGAILERPSLVLRPPPVDGAWRDHNAIAQTLHGRPIALGTSLYSPPSQEPLVSLVGHSLERGGLPSEKARQGLLELGFSQVVLHTRFYLDADDQARALIGCFGRPTGLGAHIMVFDLASQGDDCEYVRQVAPSKARGKRRSGSKTP